jgi:hypothetical protein
MPLSPGTRLGSCEILAPVGAGGMGVRTVSYTNQAGFRRAFGLRVTADLKSYAYSYARLLSELYLVDELATDGR